VHSAIVIGLCLIFFAELAAFAWMAATAIAFYG
jgi:hypothetical protein